MYLHSVGPIRCRRGPVGAADLLKTNKKTRVLQICSKSNKPPVSQAHHTPSTRHTARTTH